MPSGRERCAHMTLLTERYASQIAGVLPCFDRIIITGTLVGVCFAEGMAQLPAWARNPSLRLRPLARAVARGDPRERGTDRPGERPGYRVHSLGWGLPQGTPHSRHPPRAGGPP